MSNNPIIQGYQKFADGVYILIQWLCKIIIIIMVASVTIAVVGRYVFRFTPKWCEETGILCMVWVCFLSATLAIKDGIHIRMTIFEYFIPQKATKALHCFAYIFLLALHIAWIIAGWQLIEITIVPRMPSTQLPQATLYGSVFVMGIFGVIMSLSRLFKGEW
jgi:TRAP-type C4-dicarboxylate transport system permease small subunit